MYTVKDKEVDQDYEFTAMKLGSDIVLWRMFGPVGGHVIRPESVTCDPEGNAYVSDLQNSRILKINSLTGEVLSILLFEEEERIRLIYWSNTEPNLTLLGLRQISTYFVAK